jgi:hypothetical protein
MAWKPFENIKKRLLLIGSAIVVAILGGLSIGNFVRLQQDFQQLEQLQEEIDRMQEERLEMERELEARGEERRQRQEAIQRRFESPNVLDRFEPRDGDEGRIFEYMLRGEVTNHRTDEELAELGEFIVPGTFARFLKTDESLGGHEETFSHVAYIQHRGDRWSFGTTGHSTWDINEEEDMDPSRIALKFHQDISGVNSETRNLILYGESDEVIGNVYADSRYGKTGYLTDDYARKAGLEDMERFPVGRGEVGSGTLRITMDESGPQDFDVFFHSVFTNYDGRTLIAFELVDEELRETVGERLKNGHSGGGLFQNGGWVGTVEGSLEQSITLMLGEEEDMTLSAFINIAVSSADVVTGHNRIMGRDTSIFERLEEVNVWGQTYEIPSGEYYVEDNIVR